MPGGLLTHVPFLEKKKKKVRFLNYKIQTFKGFLILLTDEAPSFQFCEHNHYFKVTRCGTFVARLVFVGVPRLGLNCNKHYGPGRIRAKGPVDTGKLAECRLADRGSLKVIPSCYVVFDSCHPESIARRPTAFSFLSLSGKATLASKGPSGSSLAPLRICCGVAISIVMRLI